MKEMIRYEFRKLWYTRLLVWLIITLLTVEQFCFWSYYIPSIKFSFFDNESFCGLKMLTRTYRDSAFGWIAAVFVALYVCGPFTEGSIKNELACGISRIKIYISKYIVTVTVLMGFFAVLCIVHFTLGTIVADVGTTVSIALKNVYVQLLQVLALVTLFFFICALIKNVTACVLVNIAIVSFLMYILLFLDRFVIKSDFSLAEYCPTYILSALFAGGGVVDFPERGAIFSALSYVVLFFGLSVWRARKIEV